MFSSFLLVKTVLDPTKNGKYAYFGYLDTSAKSFFKCISLFTGNKSMDPMYFLGCDFFTGDRLSLHSEGTFCFYSNLRVVFYAVFFHICLFCM